MLGEDAPNLALGGAVRGALAESDYDDDDDDELGASHVLAPAVSGPAGVQILEVGGQVVFANGQLDALAGIAQQSIAMTQHAQPAMAMHAPTSQTGIAYLDAVSLAAVNNAEVAGSPPVSRDQLAGVQPKRQQHDV